VLVRLRCPGGALTAGQLKAVGKVAAEECGEGVDLTAWQEIRLHFSGEASEALRKLEAAGLEAVSVDSGPVEEPAGPRRDPLGVHEQEQEGLFSVGIPVPGGRATAGQVQKLADLAERYGDGSIVLTDRQIMLIRNLPKERVAQVLEGLRSVDLKVSAPLPRGYLPEVS
jgi:sulfite reductase beta subunit-like hemoprotein